MQGQARVALVKSGKGERQQHSRLGRNAQQQSVPLGCLAEAEEWWQLMGCLLTHIVLVQWYNFYGNFLASQSPHQGNYVGTQGWHANSRHHSNSHVTITYYVCTYIGLPTSLVNDCTSDHSNSVRAWHENFRSHAIQVDWTKSTILCTTVPVG